jgi:phage tail-like protein
VEIDGISGQVLWSALALQPIPIPSTTAKVQILHECSQTFGLRKYTNIVLKRGYTQDKSLWEWRKKTINGLVERRSADIILLNESRDEVLRWRIREAWISKWDSGPFNAKTNDVVVETVELIHEGLELV